MFTRHAIAVAVLVAATAAAAQPVTAPVTPSPKPAAKPAAAPSQPAPSTAPTAPSVNAQPATVALSVPLPRAKPKWPPSPRSKPRPPVEAARAPATPALALTASTAAQPVAATGQDALAVCGNACSEILFKTVDNCLWVQSANPRPIVFNAEIGGKPVALKLEGADPTKADAHAAAAVKGAPAKDEPAYHTRLHDPFLSVSAGIPAYRARLGAPTTCVKSRNEIQRFTATFAG